MNAAPRHHPPRIMHVITPSRMAGAETFLARLLRRTEQDLPCMTSRGPAINELLAAGVKVEPLGISGKANLLALPRLRAAARRCGADLIHSHLSTASWWAGWLEQFGGPPSIGHVHGFTSARWHRRQTHLIACSAAVKADLVEKGIAAERITVMHYPVAPADVRPTRSAAAVRAELGASNETPIVGTFAHLSLKKGYRELVRATEIVLRTMPAAEFWCFGDGPLRSELEDYARARGFADRFRLLGFRRDAANYMQAVDVMCLPSHREPFGLVYVEAALLGKPAIACDAGGAPEIIKDGVTGVLVPPPGVHHRDRSSSAIGQNVVPLADAILSILGDPSHAQRMGERGRELALKRFGWTDYLARLENLYQSVLGVAGGDGLSRRRRAG
jgi:glycosyltransferase involved in cell wall biosynthesis